MSKSFKLNNKINECEKCVTGHCKCCKDQCHFCLKWKPLIKRHTGKSFYDYSEKERKQIMIKTGKRADKVNKRKKIKKIFWHEDIFLPSVVDHHILEIRDKLNEIIERLNNE